MKLLITCDMCRICYVVPFSDLHALDPATSGTGVRGFTCSECGVLSPVAIAADGTDVAHEGWRVVEFRSGAAFDGSKP